MTVHRTNDSWMEPEFEGSIGQTVADSTPWWPHAHHSGRPNVMVVVLDDVGFAQLGCYGSSIATPRMDTLAAGGAQYTNFHATALCSPTRASLLTGRNHHAVGMGFLAAFDTGYPSYRGCVTPAAANVAEVLRDAGYGTYALGKWHLIPPGHMTPAGPFHHWPTQRGFDRYYGFLGGEEDQYRPELFSDQHRIELSARDDYHLSEDLVDHATQFVADHRSARPDDPFLLYLSFGACHAPHQAPRRFIDAYTGAFDHGWDVERERVLERQVELGVVPPDTELAPRNPGVRPWDELDSDQRAVFARMQEVFAGFLAHTDEQVGRFVDQLEQWSLLEDTVIVLMSDNGASAEGGADGTVNEYRWFLGLPDPVDDAVTAVDQLGDWTTHGYYPTGWAQAGNTPGKFYKRWAYSGGVRVPLIVHWPAGLSAHGLRGQFHHVIDIAPTLIEMCGADVPATYRGVEQMPMHGTSMRDSLTEPSAPGTRSLQYFETAGYRSIYSDGWKAVTRHEPGEPFEKDHWELYDLTQDFSECHDLSSVHHDRVAELVRLWWEQAHKYDVLPLDDRMQSRMRALDPAADRRHYELLPGSRLMNSLVGPSFSERPVTVTAHVDSWAYGHNGVLMAWGHHATGWTLYIREGWLTFDLNLGGRHTVVTSEHPVIPGTTTFSVHVLGGEVPAAQLLGDDTVLGTGDLPRLIPFGMGLLPTQCGYNSPSPVSDAYRPPFRYAGGLRRGVVEFTNRTCGGAFLEWGCPGTTPVNGGCSDTELVRL